MIWIGAARIDERGKDYGGLDGDQTGHEVESYQWTDRGGDGWNVLRYKDPEKRKKAVEAAWQIINNPKIGYNQHRHNTLLIEARKVNYQFDKITTPCSTDCCQMQVAIAESLGIKVASCYTATQVKAFMATGAFDLITGSKVAHSSDYLYAGDIGAMPPGIQGHTWIALEDGPLAYTPTATQYVVNSNALRQRSGPGTEFETIQFLPRNAAFHVISFTESEEDGSYWAQGEYKGVYGYCAMKYLTPAVALPTIHTEKSTWLRTGAGITNKRILAIPPAQTFSGTGATQAAADGRLWYEAMYNGRRGWVSSRYITVT